MRDLKQRKEALARLWLVCVNSVLNYIQPNFTYHDVFMRFLLYVLYDKKKNQSWLWWWI